MNRVDIEIKGETFWIDLDEYDRMIEFKKNPYAYREKYLKEMEDKWYKIEDNTYYLLRLPTEQELLKEMNKKVSLVDLMKPYQELKNKELYESELKQMEEKENLFKELDKALEDDKRGFGEIKNHLDDQFYYTPEIDEFHVGFEYEYRDLAYNLKDWDWFTTKLDYEQGVPTYLIDEINKKEIRVRYLSKEDIEELGWENVPGSSLFAKDKHLLIRYSNSIIEIRYLGNPSYSEATFFLGKIKNKSELKKLMKQLDIV